MCTIKVGPDAATATLKHSAEVSFAQVRAHLRQLSMDLHAARQHAEGDAPQANFGDIIDDMMLSHVAALACQTHKLHARQAHRRPQRRRATARSGGFLVARTPSGFAVDAVEFMGAESCGMLSSLA
jgi:hypothetical protein